MEYEGRICRTPMERGAFMLPVQVGCSYNACRFCMLFKHLKYRELPFEQIEAELKRVKDAGGSPETVFLGDGNAFVLGFDKLSAILGKIHEYFPACRRINMDATVKSIEAMNDAELTALREKGVNCLYIGIESGLEDVLAFMNKGNTLEEARVQIARLKEAGIDYAAHIMTGVAGKGRGIENAEATAAFLNETGPVSITNFSMFTEKKAPLWSSVEDGSFVPATVLESMEEEYRLIEKLDIPVKYEGFQDFIEVRTKGTLPKDREKMLAKLGANIEKYRAKAPVYACIDVEPGICACTCRESVFNPEGINRKINITAGEELNRILKAKYPEERFIPFNEAMIQGTYDAPLFSAEFIAQRAESLNVTEGEYRSKLNDFLYFIDNLEMYGDIVLWFGNEPFCDVNRKAVEQFLKDRDYKGKLTLNIVDEYSGEIL